MRTVLLRSTKKMLLLALVIGLFWLLALAWTEKMYLAGGILAGYVTGFFWYGVMFGRLWRSADLSVTQAKRQVVMGAILRLLLLGVVLWAALQVSFAHFLVVVTGFGLIYVLGLIMLMHLSWEVNKIPQVRQSGAKQD